MGRSAHLPAFVVAVLATATVAASALGDDAAAPAILEWSAPAPCRDREEMIRQIREIAGARAAASAAVRAAVIIRATPAGFRADVDLVTSAETNHRALEGRSCDELSDAVALVVALAINPDAALVSAPPPAPDARQAVALRAPEAPAPADAPPPSAPSVLDAAPPQLPAVSPPPREASPPPVPGRASTGAARGSGAPTLGLSVVVDGGTLPSIATGPELSAGWRVLALSLELDGAFLAPRSATSSLRGSEGADFSMLSAGGRACYAILPGAVEAGPCLGVAYEWLFARGFGSQAPSDAVGRTVSALAGLRVGARLTSRVWLGVAADGVVPFVRPDFVVENGGLVYRPAALALRGSAGVDAHF